jgi:hypothetical protein
MKAKLLRDLVRTFRDFVGADEGLVTVEWVAIAAAVVAGAVTITWLVMSDTKTNAASVGITLNSVANTAITQPAP